MSLTISSNVLEEFETYYKTKHPKSQLNLNKITRKVLHEYLTFVEEILAPRYELENIKLFYGNFPYPSIFICQKLPNTKTLWILIYKYHYDPHSIPHSLSENFPDLVSQLKKTIKENKTIIDAIDSLSPEDDDNNEWTDVKVWQYLLLTTARSLNRKFVGFQAAYASEFLENALLEKEEHITIPPYIYRQALSEILTNKLNTEIQFAEFDIHLTPICSIHTPINDFHFMYPDLSTKKQASVTLTKIDEFNRTTNKYLKKVYNRIKTTIQTFNVITKLLQ
jgi:hypothetical protein